MLTFDEAADYLDTVIDSIPEILLRELNGGICIVPHEKRSNKDYRLYTLGEYNRSRQMGRYIVIYYGSFAKSLRSITDEEFKAKLKEVVLHELTHHNESLAGRKDLEYKDEAQIEHYKNTGKFLPIARFNNRGKI